MTNGKKRRINQIDRARFRRHCKSARPEGQPMDYAPRPCDVPQADQEIGGAWWLWFLNQFSPRTGFLLCLLSSCITGWLAAWLFGWWP